MEELTEQIAAEIGPKWVQLLAKLGLDYRCRFRFVGEHKNDPKPVQETKCTRDTISLWQKGLAEDVTEKETMTQLLAVLRKVKGFEERAIKLAKNYGISLEEPLPSSSPSVPDSVTVVPSCHAAATESGQQTLTKGTLPPTISSPPTHHHPTTGTLSTKDSDNEGLSGSDLDSVYYSSSHHDHHSQETAHELKLPKSRADSPALSTSTERSEDHSYLLNAVVDISVTKHKYVILDVCQRLPASVLAQLAQSLNVPEEKIREISTDFMMVEEKYYQVLKYWLMGDNSQRTFVELRSALEACQQQAVCDIILRRLQSPGLTLRFPVV